jgi:hypothetical protein
LPWYESHGSEKGGFAMTVDKVRVKMMRLQQVDLKGGRIFDGKTATESVDLEDESAATDSVDLEDESGEVFNHMIEYV